MKDFDKIKDNFRDKSVWTSDNTIFANDCVYYPGIADSIHKSIVEGTAVEAYVIFVTHPCSDGVYSSYTNYASGKEQKDHQETPDYVVTVD